MELGLRSRIFTPKRKFYLLVAKVCKYVIVLHRDCQVKSEVCRQLKPPFLPVVVVFSLHASLDISSDISYDDRT